MYYEHVCRTCGHEWLEEHKLEEVEEARGLPCPECKSPDCYIAVTTSGAVFFKGPGWSPTGYNKHTYLDDYDKKTTKVYDRKEDLQRDLQGEAEQAELKKLKRLNEVSKKTLGPDAAVTQNEADKKIKEAGRKARKR